MSNLSEEFIRSAIKHPEIVLIAVDLIINPERRENYSPLTLILADHAIKSLKDKVLSL